MQYLKSEELAKKILFTGLDFAGKSSIILALQKEFSKIAILKPTRGADRSVFSFLGYEFSTWDLGGQQAYRINYLRNPTKYFDKTEIAIYVIDIQDPERFDDAIGYLADVIKQFKELEIEPPLYIFFHKVDPALIKESKTDLNNLILDLTEKINNATEYEKINFYETSIYDLFSIMAAISEILLNLYPKSNLIDKTLSEFGKKIEAEGLMIIDDNSLLVGRYYSNDEIKQILSASSPYFLTLHDRFNEADMEGSPKKEDEGMVVQRFGKYFQFKEIKFRSDPGGRYYLLIAKDTYEFDINLINEFVEIFQDIFTI